MIQSHVCCSLISVSCREQQEGGRRRSGRGRERGPGRRTAERELRTRTGNRPEHTARRATHHQYHAPPITRHAPRSHTPLPTSSASTHQHPSLITLQTPHNRWRPKQNAARKTPEHRSLICNMYCIMCCNCTMQHKGFCKNTKNYAYAFTTLLGRES